jgi:membrane protein required for colicin V production
MNWLNIVIIVVLAGFFISGLINGLIASFFNLLGLVLGIRLAWLFYPLISNRLGFLHNDLAAKAVGSAIIFVVVVVIAGIVGAFIKKIICFVGLGFLDRLGGAVFGLILGVLFTAGVLIVLAHLPLIDLKGAIHSSWLASFLIERFSLFFSSLLPGLFRQGHSVFWLCR